MRHRGESYEAGPERKHGRKNDGVAQRLRDRAERTLPEVLA